VQLTAVGVVAALQLLLFSGGHRVDVVAGLLRELDDDPVSRPHGRVQCFQAVTERGVGQGCAMETALLARISQPSLQEGQRTGALRFGDPRVMALAGALCILLNTVVGFTNRSLRAQVSGLLGGAYSSAQMTYDLRRLRLKGLIRRIERSNRYVLTPDGIRVAVFYTKLHNRLLGPLLAADRPPAPPQLRQALRLIDHQVDHYVQHARLGTAA